MYLGDSHAHLCPHHFVYVIDEYMPNSCNDLYGMVGVRDKWIDFSIKLRLPLVIIAPQGTQVFMPKMIKKKYKTFNQIGRFIDNPMKLYALRIDHGERKELDSFRFG